MTTEELKLTKDQQELIERMGVMFEKGGLAPAPARVIALLLVSPMVELPFEDISRLLNLSKSATSNSLNLLLTLKKIDYVTHPGERRRYFRSRVTSWKEEMASSMAGLTSMSQIMREALAQRPKSTAEFNRGIREVADFMDHLAEEMPKLIARWEKRR